DIDPERRAIQPREALRESDRIVSTERRALPQEGARLIILGQCRAMCADDAEYARVAEAVDQRAGCPHREPAYRAILPSWQCRIRAIDVVHKIAHQVVAIPRSVS